jgi:hypothetical protein
MASISILIRLRFQTLDLVEDGIVLATFPVSTSAKGAGEHLGSEQTPRGRHCIKEMIGADLPVNSIFEGRQPTGEICSAVLTHPTRDWILSRIVWLEGLEEGRNRGGDVDTYARHIYIHGTSEDQPMGVPRSHGCIRMRSDDVISLFDRVRIGTLVDIQE